MKLRKVLSLIIAIAMIMTASTAFAFSDVDVENDAYEAITALSALNILTGYEDGTFAPEGKVTRAEFATIIMRAKGYDVKTTTDTIFDDVKADHWASGAIAEAFGAAIVNGRVLNYDANGNVISGTFDPEAEVTYEEATKMIVCALGFQRMAESMVKPGVNPYPTAYNLIANQRDITTDVPKTAGGASRATIARLVWNSLTVEVMAQKEWGTDETFDDETNESLLWKDLDAVLIEEAKLVSLDLNPATTDVKFSGIRTDAVSRANGVTTFGSIKKGAVNLEGLQGLKVKALVDYSDKHNPVLLAVFPLASNKTLEVKPTLFAGFVADDKFEYYKSMDTATETSEGIEYPFAVYSNLMNKDTVALAGDPAAIVDDGAVGTASNNIHDKFDVMTAAGGIMNVNSEPNNSLYRFVDTDNNGYYDTLFIDNYASFVVARVRDNAFSGSNSAGDVFNSKVQYVAGANYAYNLDLDPDDDNLSWSLKDETGKELTVSDIAVGDVITYAKSVSGSYTYYDITVSKASTVTGSVDSIKTKTKNSITYKFFTIDGTDYLINNTTFDNDLAVGDSGTFKITADGKIIAVERDATTRNFGVILKVADTGSNFSSGMAASVALTDGTIATLNFADTYYIDDAKYETVLEKTGTAALDLDELNTAVTGDIVMYELNSEGKIKKVYTKALVDTNDIDTTPDTIAIEAKTNGKYLYKSESAMTYDLAKGTLGKYYFTDDSVVVAYGSTVPELTIDADSDGVFKAFDNNDTDSGDTTIKEVKDWLLYDDKAEYSFIGESSLEDDKAYTYTTMIVDENDNIVVAFVKDFTVLPAYDTMPAYIKYTSTVSVEGEARMAITADVGGEEITFNMAEDVDAYKLGATASSEKYTVTDALKLVAGDVIQYTLNAAGEINAYRPVVKVYNGKAHFIIHNGATAADIENDNTKKAATLVAYSLSSTSVPTIADGTFLASGNTAAVESAISGITATLTGSGNGTYGFGIAGRVHSLKGRNVNVYADSANLDLDMDNDSDSTEFDYDYSSGLVTVGYNDDLPLYQVSTRYNDNLKVGYVSALTTFKDGIGDTPAAQLVSADDLLYIFAYDDATVFQYSLDLKKNNK